MTELIMGSSEGLLVDTWAVRHTGDVVGLFLSPEHVENLEQALGSVGNMEFDIRPLLSSTRVEPGAVKSMRAVVIEVDPQRSISMQRLQTVKNENPNLPIVAAISSPDVATVRALLREGISDVVSLPIEPTELQEVILDAISRRTSIGEFNLCPLIAVVKASGGAGATTIAANLAYAFGANSDPDRPPLMLDLDVQYGNASDLLGLDRRESVIDLLKSTERVDDALIHSVATSVSGFSLIGAPREILPTDSVDVDTLLNMTRLLRQQFSSVIVDLPANWSDWSLSLVSSANLIVIVCEPSLASISRTKRTIDLLLSVGFARSKIRLVINKMERKLFGAIKPDNVSDALGFDILATLPFDRTAMENAQQEGEVVLGFAPKSKFSKDFLELEVQVRTAASGGAG